MLLKRSTFDISAMLLAVFREDFKVFHIPVNLSSNLCRFGRWPAFEQSTPDNPKYFIGTLKHLQEVIMQYLFFVFMAQGNTVKVQLKPKGPYLLAKGPHGA